MSFPYAREAIQLAMDTLNLKQTKGIPTGLVHIMQKGYIERLAGVEQGAYLKNPDQVYIKMLQNIGVNIVDQYLGRNPLSMGDHGYEGAERGATTGAEDIYCDGVLIDSPEAVAEHLEQHEFSRLRKETADFDEEKCVKSILEEEARIQKMLGPSILKTGYDYIKFPTLGYYKYGYENYFMAYILYPEIVEKHFSLQADLFLLHNKAAKRAYEEGHLPPLYRLDHDMADSKGTLVSMESLERLWFPHFVRCLKPILDTEMRLIWHCDGNLMQMVPRLLEVGIKGFQGFQYEDGMEYQKICQMKTKDREPLIIEAGVSVTRTLPMGTAADVKKEIDWLVENGPKTGLFLAASSSVLPGIPWGNIETMVEGFQYYREHGRK